MSKNFIMLAAAAACFLLAPAARAQQPAPAGAPAGGQKAAWVVACEADAKKFCEAEIKANTDVRPCLAKKDAELSQECQDKFLKGYKVLEFCKEDIEKHCKDAQGKALGQCFNDNQAKLSDKCKGALRKGSKEHAKEKAAEGATPAATAEAAPAKPAKKTGKKAAKKTE